MKGRREDPMAVLLFVVCCVLAGSTGVSGEPQLMTVGPTDTSVIQGQTAILKCVVEHIKGVLQWAKDGVLLGSERDIPGFPRYKLIGSVELGEYNLMISRVSLADDAEYQCQVTPADGDDPLMGSAHLHVLIPPALPEIQNYPNGSVIKVPHEQETVNLTCICSNGKPAATISWLRNNELITEDIQYFSSVLDNKLEDARSILTVHPQHEDNGAIYTCRAINAAIRKPLDTVVVLSVMHPPSPPEITGYATGTVKTGETLKLVCTSKGGNPLAQVYWYKNDAEIDFSYTSGGDKSVNELVFTVQPNDNEAVYRCEASNLVTSTPLTAEVKLIVEFAPKKVTISGHQHAKAGEVIKLKCETAISNPPAVVTWFTRGRQLTGAKSVQTPSPKGGFVTTSEISVMLTDRENNVIYQCHATNDALGQTVVDTVTLEVMYPPEQPTISGYTEGREVAAGQIQSLTCTSVGGNPPAELTWWKGDRLLAGTPRITGNIVTRQVSFILKPDDNNAEYRCNATNQATEEPLITSVKLQVNFPPKILTITSKPLKPSAGQQLVITCMSSSSNPASVLSWWKDGSEIEGIDGGVIDAKNGGKSTISKLQLTPTAEDDGEIYACRATNPLLETAVSDAVTLDILYIPVFASVAPTIVNIVESHSETLNFTARGNPNTVSYTWYRDGLKLTSSTAKEGELSLPHFVTDGPILNITNVKRTDTGTYVCEARNNQGKTDHSFQVNVQYSAGIIDHTKHVLMDPGTNATFECTVDANPMVDKMVTWSRAGYDMSRTVTSYVDGRYTLIVLGVVKDDSGVFTCNANNGIGAAVTADTSLVVKFAPEIDRSPAFSKAAAEKGSSAKLICKAEGAPEVTFKWFKNSQDLDTTGTKYSAEAKKVDLVHYESAMKVHNITEGDYTKYVCTAENELGTDTTVISLDGTSIPDPPYDMKFVNATHNSITLQWTAGFDGGSLQWFQVRYSETGEEGQKYEDVMPPNSAVYTIKELKLGTEYEMTVRAINKLGESAFQKGTVMAKTLAVAPTLDDSSGDDTPLIIILTVCIIGMILLALNILLILFFVRRRKKKLEKEASESCSRANTVEMFSAPTVTEDSKSFASYDRRSVGEYPDDYRTYDDEDEMKRFLPSMYTPDGYQRGPPPGMYPPPRGELRPPSPHVDHQRSFMIGKGSRDPIYLNEQMAAEQGWEPRGMAPGPYGPPVMMPHRPPSVELRDDTMDYADQLRKRQMYPGGPPMGDSPGSLPPDVRPKGGRLPPPPPQRSSSQKGDPPIPSRNYGPEDIPRYGPAPGSYAPSRNGNSLDHPLPPPPDMMGHLV